MIGKVKPTLLDRAVSWLSPELGVKRLVARGQVSALSGGAGGYQGGRRGSRSMRGWKTLDGSPDDALIPDLDDLRARSRDLERNAPLARGAISTITGSVVGTGLVPRPVLDRERLGLSVEEAARVKRAILREWSAWANSPECDLRRTATFAELQDLALRSVLVAGDVFAPIRWREGVPGSTFSTRCQLVEAERIDNPRGRRDGEVLRNGNRLVAGVELDRFGAPVAYHVRDRYSSMDRAALATDQAGAEWTRVSAFGRDGRRRVLHLYTSIRPEQSRGEPILAPVIETLRQLADYADAELQAAVVSSLFTVFVKSASGSGLAQAPTSGARSGGQSAQTQNEELALGKGSIIDLGDGDDVSFADPSRPNTNFDPFVMAVLRQIGVALELPFEVLLKHFQSSYSASRAALLEAWRMYRRRRQWLASRFCQPFYEAVIEEAVLLGRLDLPGFLDDAALRAAWCRASWRGPAPGQLDPLKEANASGRRIALHLSTHSREAAELTGEDWEDTIEELDGERARIAATAPAAPDAGGDLAVEPTDAGVDRVDQDEED